MMIGAGVENTNFVPDSGSHQANHFSHDPESQRTDTNAQNSRTSRTTDKDKHLSMNSALSRSFPDLIHHGSQKSAEDSAKINITSSELLTKNSNAITHDSQPLSAVCRNSKRDSMASQTEDASGSFIKLSSKMEKKLRSEDPAAWKAYRHALSRNLPCENKPTKKKKEVNARKKKAIQKLVNATAEADSILSQVGRWPLPPENYITTNKILMGETLYAREPKWPPYSQVKYRYPPILNKNGMPFKVSDFSYRGFVPIFLAENHENIEKLTAKEIASAFRVCVTVLFSHVYWAHQDMFNTISGGDDFLGEAKAQVKMALTLENPALPSFISMENESQLTPRVCSRQASSERESKGDKSTPTQAPEESDSPNIDMTAELSEKETLARYFPSLQSWKNAPCLGCAKTGHCWSDCPSLSCTQCGGNHSCNGCSRMRRCDRCRELGHSVAECSEKLALPKSEIVCDLCRCTGHVESACHHIWRTFQPTPQEIFKVQSINVYCYCCGAAGHYGSECGLHRHQSPSTATTWSHANLNMYIDSNSPNLALSAGTDLSLPARKGFNIKGKALNHIDSDEDSETPSSFIHPKVRRVNKGTIRIAPEMKSSLLSLHQDHDVQVMQTGVFPRESYPINDSRLQPTSDLPAQTDEGPLDKYSQVQRPSPPKNPASRTKGPRSSGKVSKAKNNSIKKPSRRERVRKKGTK